MMVGARRSISLSLTPKTCNWLGCPLWAERLPRTSLISERGFPSSKRRRNPASQPLKAVLSPRLCGNLKSRQWLRKRLLTGFKLLSYTFWRMSVLCHLAPAS
jgi:hypothetical protein